MDLKELVYGNRDPLLEFSDTMAQWYSCLQTQRKEQRNVMKIPRRNYPPDISPYWLVHVMDCSDTVPLPAAAAGRLKKAGIRLTEMRKYDGKSILMVMDASGLPLGFDLLDRESFSGLCSSDLASGDSVEATTTFYTIVTLLQRCMDFPMGGGMPRRPRRLRINDEILYRLLHFHTLKEGNMILNVELCPRALRSCEPPEGPPAFSLRWPPIHYCNICKRRSFPSRLQECPQCKAVFYCEECFLADAKQEHWCAKLASYMEHKAQLADLPFSYAAEVTSEDFSLEDFLLKNKLVSSYWLHWSQLVHVITADTYCKWLEGHRNAYEPLKEEADMLKFGPDPHNLLSLKKPLVSWLQYFKWRGLSLSSVVAPLLSSTLSIYYIITSLVPKHFPEVNILKKQSLRIHIIESYRELQTLLTFWELSVLMPHVTFELVFIRERLPSWCDKVQLVIQKMNGGVIVTDCHLMPRQRADTRSIRVKLYRSTYNMLQEPEPQPDLVIGFKPAFQQNDSWFTTLLKLQSLRVPSFFCEISELRCESSQQIMNKATGGTVSPPTINPFHCPLRNNGGDNRLPRYSNGFIFHLMYKPLANVQHPAAVNNSSIQPDQRSSSLESPQLTFRERKAAQHAGIATDCSVLNELNVGRGYTLMDQEQQEE
ncbi:zinc finger MYND domain-containing protein 15-like [Cottoperca gobio]|uniref:Zinc finger MYND domain-containing protein 15-like n=1 Tax=Cottoperca gobio TaxID=56716 RepID=A0A6J2RPH4_COTGO|nr:zinc finger MYND domain-containing protein 15 [Cottoperca gobio]